MFKKILTGYLAAFRSSLRFLALLAVCVATGFTVVYPLWKLASAKPAVYTAIFTSLLALLIGFLVVRSALKAWRRDSRAFLRSTARKLSLIGGLFIAGALVLAYQRGLAALTVAITLAVYGFFAFALPSASRSDHT